MERMKPALLDHTKHPSRSAFPRARRVAWQRAFAAVTLLTLGAAVAFGASAPLLHQDARTSPPGAGRELAKKDVQVGRFYLKIGKYDASISRFQSAVGHDPHWAPPHKFLGEAFQKKNDPKRAITEYREYLKLAPHARDAKKIERRLKELVRDRRRPRAKRR